MVNQVTMTKSQYLNFLQTVKEGIANDLVQELAQRVPVDTGMLKTSIRYRVNGENIDIVMAKHGLYVEFGTPPHIIKAKDAKALHWKSNGKDVFATQVNHPGTRPQPFIRPTIRSRLKQIVIDNVKRHAQ